MKSRLFRDRELPGDLCCALTTNDESVCYVWLVVAVGRLSKCTENITILDTDELYSLNQSVMEPPAIVLARCKR